MFRWFRLDPVEKLNKKYQSKLKEAMETQRNGNIRRYSELTEEAENIRAEMEALKSSLQSK